MIFHGSMQIFFFSKHQNKAEFKNRDDSEVLRSDFPGLRTFATSMTSTASTTSVASMTSTASFHQKLYSTRSLDHPQHTNDQHNSFFVELIIKNPIFHQYLIPFLSKAAEASLCHFLKKWLMKLKYPPLPKTLGTIVHENNWFFYPSEPLRISHFEMRYPALDSIQ